jgi:flavin-dependent dehydrogenase
LAELEQHGIGADFVHTPVYESYLLVNDGCGTVATCLFRDFHRERHYLERTVEFFREHAGLRWRTARRFGGSGNYGRVQGAAIGARLYVGEAAGFQDALFGFGLRYALISGHLAGRAYARGHPSDFEQAWRGRTRPAARAEPPLSTGSLEECLRAADPERIPGRTRARER